jgi:uncharacterized protein YeaO (DUF488 family)
VALKTKSAWTEIEEDDGLRILATRFRGRGMPTSRYDVWMANLGPSEKLLRAIHAGKVAWSEFAKQYRAELFLGGAIESRNTSIKNHGQKFTLRLIKELSRTGDVTLLCHCAEDEKHCHRHLLRALILSTKV